MSDSNSAPAGSVTQWIERIKYDRDPAAAQKLWERYWKRLVGLARRKLRSNHRRGCDEEDVVQQAFAAFFRAVENGQFENLHDRDNLWRLLVTITEHKAIDVLRKASRERGSSAVTGKDSEGHPQGFDQIPDLASPTPEFVEELISTCNRLFPGLNDREAKVAVLKAEGCTNKEIAVWFEVAERTIERVLKAIRSKFRNGV